MAKLLIRRQKKKGVQETYLVKDPSVEYSCKYGQVRVEELSKPSGSTISSHTGENSSSLKQTFQISGVVCDEYHNP